MKPLLSICIPTYNRAHLLRRALEALLPQAARFPDKVEVWVSDNASSDDTRHVVQAATHLGRVNYSCNASNIGACPNFVRLATELATGEYVWLIGDDDLLLPDAVARVVKVLETHGNVDAIVANCRLARFPEQWPTTALGGFRGESDGVMFPSEEDRPLAAWMNILQCDHELPCTGMFLHIVRRSVWMRYWNGRKIEHPPRTAMDWFPHTYMLADTMINQPSYYLGTPVLVRFGGTESFHVNHVMVFHYPRVLAHYHRRGFRGEQYRDCERATFALVGAALTQMLCDSSQAASAVLFRYMALVWRRPAGWKSALRAICGSGRPRFASKILAILGRFRRAVGWRCIWDEPLVARTHVGSRSAPGSEAPVG